MKKLLVHVRTMLKFIVLLAISVALIIAAVTLLYKPIYSVTYNGEFIGYTNDRSKLQDNINEYIKNGDGEHIAFVKIDTLPEYEICLSKRNVETNDEEILEKVKSTGTVYYKYYTITLNGEEKYFVSEKEEAEKIIEGLKDKKSTNVDKLGFVEKYSTELAEFTDVDTVVAKLYVAPVVVATTQYANTSQVINTGAKVNIGINLARPISGLITSRFGGRRSGTHTGLDIATSTGTPIKAAAGGTVTFSGPKGSYGNLVIISHGNGVQTYYAHCSALYVKAGDKVSQGDKIAAVGSTGNSTGPHLHLEVRVNGVAQNPQNYVY